MSKIKKADWWLGLSDKNKLFMLANASATSGRAITIAYTSKLGNWVNALYYYNLRCVRGQCPAVAIAVVLGRRLAGTP